MDSALLTKLQADADELQSLAAAAKRERVRGVLAAELRKVTAEMDAERERIAAQKEAAGGETKTAPSSKDRTYDVQIKNFSWDQSDKFVKLYLTSLSGVQSLPANAVRTKFTATSVEVRVEALGGKNHCFAIKETCEKMKPDKSYAKVKTDMVVIFLAKDSHGEKWEHLRAVEKAAARDKYKPPKMDDSEDPSAGLMNMMKQMYDDGDDEMKRTIAKAWTESRNKGTPGFDDL